MNPIPQYTKPVEGENKSVVPILAPKVRPNTMSKHYKRKAAPTAPYDARNRKFY